MGTLDPSLTPNGTQLESSILKIVTARWMNRRLASCFDAFCSRFEQQLRQKLILQRMQAKTHKANVHAASIYEWLDMLVGYARHQECHGSLCSLRKTRKESTPRCLALWRLHAFTAATATEVAQEAGEAAEAARRCKSQLCTWEQLQTESSSSCSM